MDNRRWGRFRHLLRLLSLGTLPKTGGVAAALTGSTTVAFCYKNALRYPEALARIATPS